MAVCKWDPVRKSTNAALSNDDLTVYMPNSSSPAFGTVARNKGKHYFEITQIEGSTNNISLGITNEKAQPNTTVNATDARTYYGYTGNKFPGAGSSGSSYGAKYGVGDCIGVAVDMDSDTIEFFKNGVSQGIAFNDIKAMGTAIYPFVKNSSSNPATVTANFGATPFKHPMPDGYLSWNDDDPEEPVDPVDPVEPTDPTDPDPTGQALLRVTMTDSSEREYTLPMAEVNAFVNWYDRTVGTGNTCYVFSKVAQNSKEYLAFEKIISFEVVPLIR